MTILVEIKSQFVRSIPSEGVYRFQLDIIDAVNIDFDVLVFDTEHDRFRHVASVYDLESFPVGKASAQLLGVAYYRGRGAQISFGTVKDALGFETITRGRFKVLAVAWAAIVDEFPGIEIVTVDSNVTP